MTAGPPCTSLVGSPPLLLLLLLVVQLRAAAAVDASTLAINCRVQGSCGATYLGLQLFSLPTNISRNITRLDLSGNFIAK
jgi:hypothetical protein